MTLPDRDPWGPIRALTTARIGLARTGDTVSGADVLGLQHAHARARTAVEKRLDEVALGLESAPVTVVSRAHDRATFVRRPDLGRMLSPESAERLPRGPYDVAFVIADGLSARAAERQAPAVLRKARALLAGWAIAPVIVAHNARVALGDEIGARLGAQQVVMMIGERPGLSAADSLSLYLTYAPAMRIRLRKNSRGCSDARAKSGARASH